MATNLKGKKASASSITTARLIMPMDANVMGNAFGGSIMKYMDEVAAMVAYRHARKNVVTASIDRMDFFEPVYVGNILILKAAVNYVGKTSMEVGIRIEAEDLITGRLVRTGSCYLTYVALDEEGKPTPIPPVIPVTMAEKKRFRQAMERRRLRAAERKAERGDQG